MFILIAGIMNCFLFIMLKVYIQDKLDGDSSLFAMMKLGRKIFSIKYLVPIPFEKYDTGKHQLIRKANFCLFAFWLAFILTITMPATIGHYTK